jgi:two-component system, cell cycle response regulator
MSIDGAMRDRVKTPKPYLAVLVAGLVALALHTGAGIGGRSLDGLFEDGLYNVLMLGAALAVLARATFLERQRLAWLTIGVGVLSWSLGELYYSLFIEGTSAEATGTVSPADALFLAMYPCLYVGLGQLAKERFKRLPIGVWLDGVIAGLAATTVAAAVILPPILDQAHGDIASIAVSSAYPLGDLLLLLFAVGVLGVSGGRLGRIWTMIAASMLLSVIADSVYLYETAIGSFKEGTLLDCLWPAGAILIAIAAWTPYRPPPARTMKGWEAMSAPMAGLLSAVGVLVYGNLAQQLSPPVMALALLTLAAVGAHLILTTREDLALLARSQQLSVTDPLTGLGNRRRLIGDLQLACASAKPDAPWQLVLYDLDGFKRYNDSFGHPAGDELLTRLSARLAAAVQADGIAYRMGGDEFCVLFECRGQRCAELAAEGARALRKEGPGFAVTASHGAVLIPTEANDPTTAIQLADQRLYRSKEALAARRISADADDGEPALAAWQRDRDLLAGTTAEQRPGDGRLGGDATLSGRGVV